MRAELATLLGGLAGIPCVFEDSKRPFVDPVARAILLLRPGAVVQVGRHYDRVSFDAGAPLEEFSTQTNVWNRYPLRLRVNCFEQGELTAWEYLEKLRVAVTWQSSRTALRALGFGFTRFTELVDLSDSADDHIVSSAACDLLLNQHVTGDSPDKFTYIASVEGTIDLEDVPPTDFEVEIP